MRTFNLGPLLTDLRHEIHPIPLSGVIARFVPEITLRKKNGRTWGSVQYSSDPVSRCPANPEPFGSLAGGQSGFNEFLGGRNGVWVKRGG